MTPEKALEVARKTWPDSRLRKSRKVHVCDNAVCSQKIWVGDIFVDPIERNPYRAGGYGSIRYCLNCAGGVPELEAQSK